MVDLSISLSSNGADLELGPDDLVLDEGLRSAVLVSLFTDGRAEPEDAPFADGTDDPRGFWADAPGARLGSTLWTFERSGVTLETIAGVRDSAESALAWLLSEGIAESVLVVANRGRGIRQIELSVSIARSNAPRWSHLWSGVDVETATTASAPGVNLNLLFR